MRKDDIEVLEEKVQSLKNENNLVEALTSLEKLITIKSERFGKKSEEVSYDGVILVQKISKRFM